ncbi:carbohydrate kinase family protein [Kitasatospora griseola]|uniref:carbohydrate kinase family protein n=1 Tax=Kitasatospora griseola TaxID=2064 RepID=UPI0016702C02|nr:carbohydrate kinase [Kitasatospora griseola]GGQ96408.1 fructokinase [Kitasatospora griseola]
MAGRSITVVGECVADAFVEPGAARPGELALRVLPGGGPANTAVALARLGTPTRFLGRISGDPFGELFRAHLAGSGVELSGAVRAAEPSTLALAALDGDGHADYSFHAEGTADWQWTGLELAAARADGSVCVHTGSLALVREPGGPRIEDLLADVRAGATVSIDPNVRPLLVGPEAYRRRLPRWCELADLLRLSADDLALLLPDTTPEQACDHFHRAGARLVVITLAEHGALASLDGRRVRVPAPPTPVVDTVGAGDSFTAGLLHSLAEQGVLGGRLDALTAEGLERACAFAARVAARTVAVAGANPPWAGEL